MDKILKPCPFCGGPGKLYHSRDSQSKDDLWWVDCYSDTDFCPVNPWTGFFGDKDEAIEAWNRRADNG